MRRKLPIHLDPMRIMSEKVEKFQMKTLRKANCLVMALTRAKTFPIAIPIKTLI